MGWEIELRSGCAAVLRVRTHLNSYRLRTSQLAVAAWERSASMHAKTILSCQSPHPSPGPPGRHFRGANGVKCCHFASTLPEWHRCRRESIECCRVDVGSTA